MNLRVKAYVKLSAALAKPADTPDLPSVLLRRLKWLTWRNIEHIKKK